MQRWLFFMLTILLNGYCMPSFAQNQNILIFGDSLSAGYGMERGEEWPSLMQKRLLDLKLPYAIKNHSISGETTNGGLSRFKASLDKTNPVIVILELGANDGLRGLSLKSMSMHLQNMLDMAHQRKIRVLLVGMRLPSNYGAKYTNLFHKQFTKLAEKNHVAFLPFLMQELSTGLEMYQADGIHPTAKAQLQMMENVWSTLKPLLGPHTP
jgi:acyl-CoA thioesterase-1